MSKERKQSSQTLLPDWMLGHGALPTTPKVIILAGAIGIVAGYGAVLFTLLIEMVTALTVEPFVGANGHWANKVALCFVPALGLLFVS